MCATTAAATPGPVHPRVIHFILVLLAFTALFVCWCGLPLIWDGAYQFAATLHARQPYVYLTRFHTAVLWQPLVWLSRVTDDLRLLTLAFGLPFCAAPFVSLAVSWWLVRKAAPELMLWAVLGVCGAGLCGQVFIINDSMWQQTLFWPVLLAMLVPLTVPQRVAVALLGAAQLVHQAGVVMLGVATAGAILAAVVARAPWRESVMKPLAIGTLLVLAIAKAAWISSPALAGRYFDSYAAQQATWAEAARLWRDGVEGPPLIGLVCVWTAAALHFFKPVRVRWLAIALTLAACGIWIWWGLEPARWIAAISYRRWVVPIAMPFYLLAIADSIRRPRGAAPPGARRECDIAALAVAAAFCTVLCAQAISWAGMLERFRGELRRHPGAVVTRGGMPWIEGTPMDHWGLTAAAMLLQGKTPQTYFAFDEASAAAARAAPPVIHLSPGHLLSPEPGPAGWFDHRPILRTLRREREYEQD